MISDVEHFFLYPLAICIFSGKNICLVPFLNQVDCYIISIIYILYIFWRLSLIRYTCCKHFLPVYRLPFHFVDYFAVQKYFNLYSHLLIFLFYFFFFFASWEDQVIPSHWLIDRLPDGAHYIVIRDHSPF